MYVGLLQITTERRLQIFFSIVIEYLFGDPAQQSLAKGSKQSRFLSTTKFPVDVESAQAAWQTSGSGGGSSHSNSSFSMDTQRRRKNYDSDEQEDDG
jgi:hypothetical protein